MRKIINRYKICNFTGKYTALYKYINKDKNGNSVFNVIILKNGIEKEQGNIQSTKLNIETDISRHITEQEKRGVY